MTLGLGSGRAVWAAIDAIGDRWAGEHDLRVAVASEATFALAHAAGLEIVQLDGTGQIDLTVDGTDEIDPDLRLLKGGSGALLREKTLATAAKRFGMVAE